MSKRYRVLRVMPKPVHTGGMHPETKKIIDQIKATRGNVLAWTVKTPPDAKRRIDALRRAKARGHVNYKEAARRGNALYFRLK